MHMESRGWSSKESTSFLTAPCKVFEGQPALGGGIDRETTCMGQEKWGRLQKDIGCWSQGVIGGLDESDIALDGSDEGKEQKKMVEWDWL